MTVRELIQELGKHDDCADVLVDRSTPSSTLVRDVIDGSKDDHGYCHYVVLRTSRNGQMHRISNR